MKRLLINWLRIDQTKFHPGISTCGKVERKSSKTVWSYLTFSHTHVYFILTVYLQSTLLSAFIKYVMDTMVRIEGKVESNEEKLEALIRDKETLYRSLEMVRQKQEMVLTKQDQLHFTLHGETAPRDTSPMYTTPPLTSPTLPFRRSVTPVQPISEVASVLETCDLESILSNISFSPPPLSVQPQGDSSALHQPVCISSAVGTPQQGVGGVLSAVGTLQQGVGGVLYAVGTSQQGVGGVSSTVGTPQQGVGGMLGTPQQVVGGVLSAVGTPQQGVGGVLSAVGTPQQGVGGVLSAVGTPQQGMGGAFSTLQPGSSSLKTPLRTPASVLQNPADVSNDFPTINEHDVGKLARALAVRAIFGTDVLRVSTLTGDLKRGLKMLDKNKLTELCSVVHRHPSFRNYSRAEFDEIVTKRILPSLSHMCKEELLMPQ